MVVAPIMGLMAFFAALLPLLLIAWVLVVLYRLVTAVEGIQGTLDRLAPRLARRDDRPGSDDAPDG